MSCEAVHDKYVCARLNSIPHEDYQITNQSLYLYSYSHALTQNVILKMWKCNARTINYQQSE